MDYKTILVHVDMRPDSDGRVRVAADLARQFDATLIGLTAGFPRPIAYFDGFTVTPDLMALDRSQIEDDLKSAGARFRAVTGDVNLRTDWRALIQLPGQALTDAANAADLIVVGAPDPKMPMDEYRSCAPGDVLMRAGRPVLVLPPGKAELGRRSIVVAWKNTREARRAVADAMPLLKGAETVFLVDVVESDEETGTMKDAMAHLQRHGVEGRVERLVMDQPTVADQLLHFATQNGVDLIVAGAYGRSRLREWAFGGVTSELVDGCPLACLFSH